MLSQISSQVYKPSAESRGSVQVKQEAEEMAALNAREAAELAAAPTAADLTEADEEAAEEAVQAHAVSMLHACRSVDAYERLDRISEGTYGIVFRCGPCPIHNWRLAGP